MLLNRWIPWVPCFLPANKTYNIPCVLRHFVSPHRTLHVENWYRYTDVFVLRPKLLFFFLCTGTFLCRICKHSKICNMIFLVSFWVKFNLAPPWFSILMILSFPVLHCVCVCLSVPLYLSMSVCVNMYTNVYGVQGTKLEYHFLRPGTWKEKWAAFPPPS